MSKFYHSKLEYVKCKNKFLLTKRKTAIIVEQYGE